MRYKVALYHSEEGFSVCVPALPGCWSEGDTEQEALENIQDTLPSDLGLSIMKKRAEEIGASLKISSQPDQGTEVLLEWPFD